LLANYFDGNPEIKLFDENKEYFWEVYDYNQNSSEKYIAKMSKDYENLKMDDLKLFELDMNPQCDLCYNV
jgi:hypothetical protein